MRRTVASLGAMALAVAFALAPGGGAARADEPAAAPLDTSLRVLKVRSLVTELDLAAADEAIAGGDPSDPLLAIERARARLWRQDCEGASSILARPDLEASKDAATLIAVSRGCMRAMAATVLVTDEARGVVMRFQDDADRPLAPYLADVAAKARDVMIKDLGVTLPRPLYVEVVRDQHSLSALTGLPLEAAATTGTVAVAKWGRVTMLSPRAMTSGYPWLDTAAHELTHMALTRGSADKAPLWLQEGVAKREETKWRLPEPFDDRPPAHDLAAFGLVQNIGPAIDDIGPSIALLPSAEESMVTYAKVQSFIDHFATEAGPEALPKLVVAMKDATDPDDLGPAVEKASGTGFATWKERWEAWVKARAKELPPDQKPGAPPPAHWADVRRHVRLGDLLEMRGHHDAARVEREAAFALAPTDGRVRSSLAASLVHLDRRDEARLLVQDAAEVRSGTGRWWSLRGLLVEADAEVSRAAALARDPLAPEIACEEKAGDDRPTDPDRAAICDMARRAPREQPATTHPAPPAPAPAPAVPGERRVPRKFAGCCSTAASGTVDAVLDRVVIRGFVGSAPSSAFSVRLAAARGWASFARLATMSIALVACAQSDAIEPGETDDGFGGRDAGSGGTSGSEAGPEGSGGTGGRSSQGPAGVGGADGDDVSSAATGIPDVCGNDTCDLDNGETCSTCPGDCGACEEELCGDGTCDAAAGETCETCEADCGACASCGDGVCDEPTEDCDLCSEDCGVCMCEVDDLEPNGGSPTASPLAIGVEVEGLSICASDFDWFSFPVDGPRTVTISFAQADGDLDLEIYSQATGNYVTGSYSADDDEQVVLDVANGTYWARVYGDGAAENWSYSILVE